MPQDRIRDVLTFWFEESTPEQWFKKDDAFDAIIRERFLETYEEVVEGNHGDWRETAEGCLAEIIVLDQFSRNMFRNDPRAFEADPQARACLHHALARGFDEDMTVVQRKFLYLPLEHSEDAQDQVQAVELYTALGEVEALDYAVQHKVIIDRFGRFPHRNKVLGRESTEEEKEFLTQPGSSF